MDLAGGVQALTVGEPPREPPKETLALTSTTEQHREVLEDLENFVRTVHPSAQEEN